MAPEESQSWMRGELLAALLDNVMANAGQTAKGIVDALAFMANEESVKKAINYLTTREVLKSEGKKDPKFSVVSHDEALRHILDMEASRLDGSTDTQVAELLRSECRYRERLRTELEKLTEKARLVRGMLRTSEQRIRAWGRGEEVEMTPDEVFAEGFAELEGRGRKSQKRPKNKPAEAGGETDDKAA
jgi:hypothetical protein